MPNTPKPKHVFIFMGVCGCGKSTIAQSFANSINGLFLDGDDFHPPANVEKMTLGTPLNDLDRSGWILAIRQAIINSPQPLISIACSALKKKHRDTLRSTNANTTFIHLHGTKELLSERLAQRRNHFMPPTLLDSQLADLETPTNAIQVNISSPPDTIITALRSKFAL